MKHVVGQIAVTNLTNSTVTIRASLLPGQSRAIKILPYKTISVDRDIVVMALAEFRKDKAKGVIWFDEEELFADSGITGMGGGETGQVGSTGLIGTTGLIGPTGPQGVTGLAGLAGGATGLIGIQGETGIGVTGPKGEQGDQGYSGATGLQGNTGVPGSYVSNLITLTLDDNQTLANNINLTFPKTTEGVILQYKARLNSTGDMRVGMIYVANNGTLASVQDNFAETDDIGIFWDTFVDLSNLYLLYSTSSKSSQRYMVSSIQIL